MGAWLRSTRRSMEEEKMAKNLPLVGLTGVAFLLAGAVVAGIRRRKN